MLYEQKRSIAKERWYIAIQPPAIFLLLFVFFNLIYGGAVNVWQPFIMDIFGFTFAILIILYLGSMFTWKTVGLFAILLTILDIILVIGTGTMVDAAQTFTGLGSSRISLFAKHSIRRFVNRRYLYLEDLGLATSFSQASWQFKPSRNSAKKPRQSR